MATILVTGASGFIGRYLVLKLLQQHDKVFALFRNPERQLKQLKIWLLNQQLQPNQLEQLSAIYGDFSQPHLDISSVDWQRMQQVSVIYQCAALYQWDLTPQQARQINVTAPIILLQLASQQMQLSHFVQISGYMLTLQKHLLQLGINITQPEKTQWDNVYNKVGSYEASKLESHYAIQQAARQQQIPLTLILPAAVIGDSQSGELDTVQPIYQTFSDLIQGKLAAIPGSSKHRLPLISVDYVAGFMAKITGTTASINQQYLLLDNRTPPLKQVLEIAAQVSHVKAPLFHVSIGLLQCMARWPRLAQAFNLAPEALTFIRKEQFDTHKADKMAESLGLNKPAIEVAIQKTASYVQQTLIQHTRIE